MKQFHFVWIFGILGNFLPCSYRSCKKCSKAQPVHSPCYSNFANWHQWRILCTLRINGRNLEQCFPISSRQTGTRSTQVLKGGIGVRVVKWWKAGMQIMCISWQIAKKSWYEAEAYEASTRKVVMWVLNLVLLGSLGVCRLRFGAWAHQWCSSALFVMAGVPKYFESRPLTVSTGVIFESFEVCLVSRFCGALTEMESWS